VGSEVTPYTYPELAGSNMNIGEWQSFGVHATACKGGRRIGCRQGGKGERTLESGIGAPNKGAAQIGRRRERRCR